MSQAGILNANGGGTGGPIRTLTGDSGGAVGPDGAGNINTVALYTNTVVGNPGTNTTTLTPTSRGYPITPYVVGPSTFAGYQTIQAAATAAGNAGGGTVYIQGGTYTENLTIPSEVSFYGENQGVTIIGQHTPPSSSTAALTFDNITFVSATDVLNSSAAGTTVINFNNSFFVITNGYVMNLPNWTGELLMDNCGEASTNDGGINNSGGSAIKLINVEIGAGSANTMNITSSNFLRIDTCNVNCPVNMSGSGQIIVQNGVKFANNVTIDGSLSGFIIQTVFSTGANQSLTYNSSGNTFITGSEFNSSFSPVIGGTGTGSLNLSGISFVNGKNIAGALNISTTPGFFPAKYTAHGVLLAEGEAVMSVTNAATDGQVLLGATGADPAFATLTSSDSSISFTTGANSLSLQVAGGTTVGKTITGDSGGALSPTSGNWNLLGRSGSKTSGTGSTLTIKSPPYADEGGSTTVTLNSGSFATAAITLTLPASAGLADGDLFEFVCTTAGALVIQSVSAQKIRLGNLLSSAAGTLTSTAIGDSVTLRFRATDGFFYTTSSMGNWTVA